MEYTLTEIDYYWTKEAKELINEYVRIAEFTKLNDKFLLDGSFNSDFMVGSSINESIDVEITGLLNKNPISLQNTATGSSEKILRSDRTLVAPQHQIICKLPVVR